MVPCDGGASGSISPLCPALLLRYLDRAPLNLKTEAALCSARLGRAVVIDRLPLQQSRLRPGSRKLKQTLPFLVGFGRRSRNDRLLSVLPELICYRHGHSHVPSTCLRSWAVAVCLKLTTIQCQPSRLCAAIGSHADGIKGNET